MKKLILILALMVSIDATVSAQTDDSGKKNKSEKGKGGSGKGGNGKGGGNNGKTLTPQEKADKITNRLKTELSLTDEQVPKVSQITLTRVNAIRDAKTASKENKQTFGQERKKIVLAWEANLKTILTPEQFSTYTTKKEERKKKIKEAKANGKPVDEGEEEEVAE